MIKIIKILILTLAILLFLWLLYGGFKKLFGGFEMTLTDSIYDSDSDSKDIEGAKKILMNRIFMGLITAYNNVNPFNVDSLYSLDESTKPKLSEVYSNCGKRLQRAVNLFLMGHEDSVNKLFSPPYYDSFTLEQIYKIVICSILCNNYRVYHYKYKPGTDNKTRFNDIRYQFMEFSTIMMINYKLYPEIIKYTENEDEKYVDLLIRFHNYTHPNLQKLVDFTKTGKDLYDTCHFPNDINVNTPNELTFNKVKFNDGEKTINSCLTDSVDSNHVIESDSVTTKSPIFILHIPILKMTAYNKTVQLTEIYDPAATVKGDPMKRAYNDLGEGEEQKLRKFLYEPRKFLFYAPFSGKYNKFIKDNEDELNMFKKGDKTEISESLKNELEQLNEELSLPGKDKDYTTKLKYINEIRDYNEKINSNENICRMLKKNKIDKNLLPIVIEKDMDTFYKSRQNNDNIYKKYINDDNFEFEFSMPYTLSYYGIDIDYTNKNEFAAFIDWIFEFTGKLKKKDLSCLDYSRENFRKCNDEFKVVNPYCIRSGSLGKDVKTKPYTFDFVFDAGSGPINYNDIKYTQGIVELNMLYSLFKNTEKKTINGKPEEIINELERGINAFGEDNVCKRSLDRLNKLKESLKSLNILLSDEEKTRLAEQAEAERLKKMTCSIQHPCP